MDHEQLRAALDASSRALVEGTAKHPTLAHLDRVYLPSREAVKQIVKRLRQLCFPGYFGERGLSTDQLADRTRRLVGETFELLYEQIRYCLRYHEHIAKDQTGEQCADCDDRAREIVATFFNRMSDVRDLLASDVGASFEGDPAAQNPDETIFSYPGLFAVTVQRLAHEFYKLEVPLLPRMMTEGAHASTGIDIHPGAKLGPSLFIDHGTGVVIGETSDIGRDVKIYQGVTLGALAPAYGQLLRGTKRHPTIEDEVTIYAGATILGGETVIGKGSTIGGNVFLTSSVPPYNVVTTEPPRLKFRDRRRRTRGQDTVLDFQI
jgi:serine O-acetyltransferase